MRILRALLMVAMFPVVLAVAVVAVVIGVCRWVAEKPKPVAPMPEHERVMGEVAKALRRKTN